MPGTNNEHYVEINIMKLHSNSNLFEKKISIDLSQEIFGMHTFFLFTES